MAGHSQFANIMHRKGKQDAVKSKIFSKLAREITVAAKAGLPDPEANARLRLAIPGFKALNMVNADAQDLGIQSRELSPGGFVRRDLAASYRCESQRVESNDNVLAAEFSQGIVPPKMRF